MPEGHTLHHHTRKQHRWFAGLAVQCSSPQGRFADGAARLDGQQLVRASARGKHAFYTFEAEDVLHVHLGLYGRFRDHRPPPPEPRGAVRLRMVSDRRALDLIGPTRCELLTPEQHVAQLEKLGQDPLDDAADPARVVARLSRTSRPIGATLLDQGIIAGIGNVYRAELLFLSGLDPRTPSKALSEATVLQLWRNTVALMRVGAQHNQIRVVGEQVEGPADAEDLDLEGTTIAGRFGPRRDRLWVYKRAACKVCGHDIATSEIGARTLYHCPSCQQGRGA